MASQTAYSMWAPQKPTLFDGHYLRNRSTLDIGVLGYIGIFQHKEHSPEVLHIPPGTPCVNIYIYIYVRCSIFTVRNFTLALSGDFFYRLSVPWSVR